MVVNRNQPYENPNQLRSRIRIDLRIDRSLGRKRTQPFRRRGLFRRRSQRDPHSVARFDPAGRAAADHGPHELDFAIRESYSARLITNAVLENSFAFTRDNFVGERRA